MSIVYCDRITAFGDVAWLTGDGSDPQIPDGIHWHVTMGPAGGLPAGPAVIIDVQTNDDSFRGVNPVLAFPWPGPWRIDTDHDEELTLVVDKPAAGAEVLGWALIRGEGELTLSAADPRLTRSGLWSTNAARSKPAPGGSGVWWLASADCEVVRVTGHGTVSEASAWICTGIGALDHGRVLARASLAKGTARTLQHYLPAREGSDDWESRVGMSAPLFRLPSDSERPREYDPDPAREIARIRAIIEPSEGVQGVGAWCAKAYGSLDRGARGTVDGENRGTTVSLPADDAYLQASVDPGVARWQGLSGTFDREPEPTRMGLMGLAAALVPVFQLRGPDQPARPDPGEVEMFYEEEIGGFLDLQQATRDFPPLEDGSRWELSVIAVPLPYLRQCPQDGPERPDLLALGSSWNAVTANRWAATVGLDRVVPRGEVAFVQTRPTAATMHPGPGGAPAPMIAGFSKPDGRHVVSAGSISGDTPTIDVAVHLEDWLGRWGDAGELTLQRPSRPPVPTPRGRTFLIPGPIPAGEAAASTAAVRVDITVQWPTGPGSIPLSQLRVSLPRTPAESLLTVTPGDVVNGMITRAVEFSAAETIPGEVTDDVLTLQSTDAEGRTSSRVAVTARIVDPRPIRAPRAGPRLIATTRRGNSPTVTVTLAITAAPNARAYRVLMAGETALRAAFGLPAPDPAEPRAERAATVRRAMHGRDKRNLYAWISTAATPVIDGTARATIELPAGIDGVIFARAVAVTTIPGNPPTETVTTPFERTEPVAVVVPRSDFPPVPDLKISTTADGAATVTVRVTRPQAAILHSLHINGEPPARIQARLVEYLGGPASFWPEITTITLEPTPGDPTVHQGTAILRGQPWRRSAVAACVRYPAEPTLAAGAYESGSEIRSTGLQHEQIPSPWGPFSTPAWIDTPGPVPTLEFTRSDGTITVTATGVPVLPPAAPTWTMQLLTGAVSLSPAPDPSGDPVPASAGLTLTPAPNQNYAIMLHDPFGGTHGPVPVPAP